MTIRIADQTQSDMVDVPAVAANSGKVIIYTGAQPLDPDDADTGTKLVEFDLQATAFTGTGATRTCAGVPISGTGLAAGTAGWFQVVGSADEDIIDGSVGTDLTLDNTSIEVGQTVNLTSLTLTMPMSA